MEMYTTQIQWSIFKKMLMKFIGVAHSSVTWCQQRRKCTRPAQVGVLPENYLTKNLWAHNSNFIKIPVALIRQMIVKSVTILHMLRQVTVVA